MPIDNEIFGDLSGDPKKQDDVFRDVPATVNPTIAAQGAKRNFGVNVDIRPESDPTRGGGTLKFGSRFGTLDTGLPMSEGFTNFLAGWGRGLVNAETGAKQLLGIGPTPAQVDRQRELDKPLRETKSGTAGNVFGDLTTVLPTMFVPGVNTIVGGGITGGLLGAAQPVGEGDSRLSNAKTSALFGAALPATFGVLRSGNALLEPLYSGGRKTIAGRTLNAAAGKNSPIIADRMANAREIVPGSFPTAAEVAESGGISALQRAASAADPEAYTQRAMEQASARLNSLRSVAGDARSLADQKAVRDLMAGPLYREAENIGVDQALAKAMKPQIDNLMDRPSMKTAVSKAREIFGEESVAFGKDTSVKALQLYKQSLDDIIEKAGGPTSSIGKNQLRALQQTRSDLISTIEDLSPKLREADAAYRLWSKPVNEMKVGQVLLDKAQPALSDYGALGKETAARYAQALRNAPSTIRDATGMPFSSLSDVMSTSAQLRVENIARDLARKSNAQDLGRGAGSDTFQKLSMNNLAAQSGMPNTVNFLTSLPGVNRATNWAYRDADQKIRNELAQALLDHKLSAELMKKNVSGKASKSITSISRVNPLLAQAPPYAGLLSQFNE